MKTAYTLALALAASLLASCITVNNGPAAGASIDNQSCDRPPCPDRLPESKLLPHPDARCDSSPAQKPKPAAATSCRDDCGPGHCRCCGDGKGPCCQAPAAPVPKPVVPAPKATLPSRTPCDRSRETLPAPPPRRPDSQTFVFETPRVPDPDVSALIVR